MTKTFYLKSKAGKDIIHRLYAENHDDAVRLFSNTKRLSKDELLKIFLVTDQV